MYKCTFTLPVYSEHCILVKCLYYMLKMTALHKTLQKFIFYLKDKLTGLHKTPQKFIFH